MWTVPAHSFWAPTRARSIAAARVMPGVWGVLASSWSPGTTLTPVCFQPSGGIGVGASSLGMGLAAVLEAAGCRGMGGRASA